MTMLAIATPASDSLSAVDTAQQQRPWQHARSDPSDREGLRLQLQATVLLATSLFQCTHWASQIWQEGPVQHSTHLCRQACSACLGVQSSVDLALY